MPILIRYAPSSLTREQYDKVNEILQENGPDGPPPPLQLHVMFGEEPDLRVSEIWGIGGRVAASMEWRPEGRASNGRRRAPRAREAPGSRDLGQPSGGGI